MKATTLIAISCLVGWSAAGHCRAVFADDSGPPSAVISLDGPSDWLVAFDVKNVGRTENWQHAPRPDAKRVRVPGVYQEALPGCHGVAWYWRDVTFPAHPQAAGRYLLRFWMVNYLADVWLNDVHVGRHEGGEEAFTLDVTQAAKPGAVNRIAVRVLSPTDEAIDGLSIGNTPQRGRRPHRPIGSEYQYGGFVDSVELLVAPAVRVEDLFVRPDCATGDLHITAKIRNAGREAAAVSLRFSVAPAASGEAIQTVALKREIPSGDTLVETRLHVDRPTLWQPSDPYLYRVTARVGVAQSCVDDELSTRCGFRDFRFVDGAFRLNGQRIFLKSSHSGNMFPGGHKLPLDADLLRRDLLNSKAMGFNMIRFFGAIASRRQLDYCDEIGLLVYQESSAAWVWNDSPQMAERFDTSIRGMITRDRNHPSVVIWGLLNETGDGAIFRHAVQMVPLVRSLDDTRVTMLDSGLEQFVPRQKTSRRSPNSAGRGFGALCNPGQTAWEDTLCDEHRYQRFPQLPEQIRDLRDYRPGKPVFLSEYGISSSVDLPRQLRHYEQIGLGGSEDANVYRGFYNSFLGDWKSWNMADTFGTPENYFRLCAAKMAGLRSQGLNAIRASPVCVGHSMSGTYDHGSCGEGAAGTEFRDLKPGATDALFDGFYPLRLCLFTEPYHVYRGAKVQLKAVLANENALAPGEYPIRLQVVGPDRRTLLCKTVNVKIQDPKVKPEQAMAIPLFGENLAIAGPSGRYQFLAAFEKGGAAAGGTAEFYASDAAEMPEVNADLALWGDEPIIAGWVADRKLKSHKFGTDHQATREVIVVGRRPGGNDPVAWRQLAAHVARGSTVIFLSPQAFQKGNNPVGWAPLKNKGTLAVSSDWFYPHDPWTKEHPIFDGLPSGGLMDYTFYRNLISDTRWAGLDVPAELVAAAINTSFAYDSGVLLSVHRWGEGRFILNTFGILEYLGEDPAAERLLRNMIRYAARDAAKPLAGLPADFQEQLKTMGY
jgi:hypothetical protein